MADFLAAPSDWLGAQVGEMRLARGIWECNELVLWNQLGRFHGRYDELSEQGLEFCMSNQLAGMLLLPDLKGNDVCHETLQNESEK